jgi:biopolymer transport protein ExbD
MAANVEPVGDDEPISAINIVPFVDIVLVLLIIFMVTSTAIVRASFSVALPRAASAGEGVGSTVNVVVTADSELFMNGEPTTKDALAASVRAEAHLHPELQAVIAADKRTAYGEVVSVIDIVKQNGVKSFALNVERELGTRAAGAN